MHRSSDAPVDTQQPQAAPRLPELIEGTFCFPHDDPVYAEHFPGSACVPGSMLIQAFVMAARQHGITQNLTAKGFRFRRFVAPANHRYAMQLRNVCGSASYQCILTADGTRAVTGTLICS
ncbi:hypothetical protein [Oleidesulfovibrio sp.]|uniref:hypothetical protein n=1 Tax=Oleidesulfovibrio sp. TaxID=2909707 RepID=UPI003A87A3E5